MERKSAEVLAAGLGNPKCFLTVLRMMDCGLKPGTFDFITTFETLGNQKKEERRKKKKKQQTIFFSSLLSPGKIDFFFLLSFSESPNCKIQISIGIQNFKS